MMLIITAAGLPRITARQKPNSAADLFFAGTFVEFYLLDFRTTLFLENERNIFVE